MTNKYDFIRDNAEFIKFLSYQDGFIKDLQRHPNPELVKEMYIRYIIDRDELLNLGIERNYTCI